MLTWKRSIAYGQHLSSGIKMYGAPSSQKYAKLHSDLFLAHNAMLLNLVPALNSSWTLPGQQGDQQPTTLPGPQHILAHNTSWPTTPLGPHHFLAHNSFWPTTLPGPQLYALFKDLGYLSKVFGFCLTLQVQI
jgi:hypothetical protein